VASDAEQHINQDLYEGQGCQSSDMSQPLVNNHSTHRGFPCKTWSRAKQWEVEVEKRKAASPI